MLVLEQIHVLCPGRLSIWSIVTNFTISAFLVGRWRTRVRTPIKGSSCRSAGGAATALKSHRLVSTGIGFLANTMKDGSAQRRMRWVT